MRLLTDEGARIAIVALVMMTICSSLLGVVVGWKLRGREVQEWKKRSRYYRRELQKVWEAKGKGENGKAG